MFNNVVCISGLTITKRDFCCWTCNLFTCSHRVNFFELFTKCLQNRCNQIWRIRVQQRSLHLRIRPVSLSNSLRMQVALQDYSGSPAVCQESHCFTYVVTWFRLHLLNVPSAHWSSFEVRGSFFGEFPHRGFSPRCMSSSLFQLFSLFTSSPLRRVMLSTNSFNSLLSRSPASRYQSNTSLMLRLSRPSIS